LASNEVVAELPRTIGVPVISNGVITAMLQ
jgi:hypothetical protein